jgi:hypothetical protein
MIEAGIELDAKVAEALGFKHSQKVAMPGLGVMGIEEGECVSVDNLYHSPVTKDREVVYGTDCKQLFFINDGEMREWYPSTDLNHAFEAALKVLDSEFGFHLSGCNDANGPCGWTCTLLDDTTRTFAPTAALAICEAVIAAAKVKDK